MKKQIKKNVKKPNTKLVISVVTLEDSEMPKYDRPSITQII